MPTEIEAALVERQLLQIAPDAMIAVDRSGRIIQANVLAERLFGYPPGTLAGQPVDMLIPERLRTPYYRHLLGHFRNPPHRSMGSNLALWGLRRDDTEFPVEVSLTPLQTPAGAHILIAIRDVSDYRRLQQAREQATVESERKVASRNAELLQANARLRQQIDERAQTEAALREAEAHYRQLVENQPDPICRFLPDTTLTFVNAAYARFLGNQPEKLIGKRFIEFLGPEEQAEAWARLAACTPTMPARQYEHKTQKADGVPRWHLWRDFAFFDPQGQAVDFQSVGVEITERKKAEEMLIRESQFRRAIIECAAEGLCVCHNTPEFPYVEFTVWNSRMEEITGYTLEEINRWGWYQSLYPDPEVRDRAQARMARMRDGDNLMGEEWEITHATGAKRIVSISTSVVEDAADSVHVLALIYDTTERKRAEDALFEQKERAQVTLHSIGDAVITTNARAVVDYLNPMAETLTGWTMAEARGRRSAEVFQLVDEQSRQPVLDPVTRCFQEGRTVSSVNHSVLIGRDGKEYDIDDTAAPIRGRDGQVLGAVLIFRDVGENRRLARQLMHDATHDALTGLINRAEFERRLQRALTSAQQYGAHHALCYLDLDQFKIVNDTAGHAAGDKLLGQINVMLSGMFRDRDSLARIGGDEFGLLLDNCPLDRAQAIAQTVVDNIRDHRFDWKGRGYQIGVSIGLVPITKEARDTAQLLTQADVACYTAKEMGRNRIHVYRHGDSETLRRHSEILGAAGLRDALEQGRFRLHYQPIMPLNAPDHRAIRYEALLRVAYKDNPDESSELVLPAAFIPVAERYGLMSAIDRWVIQTAFRDYADGIGQTSAKIAINLSADSLNDETLLDFIEAQFAEHAFPPAQVCFEITETAAIQNLRQALKLLAALKHRGSQLALDDFGSGLSSFHYLKTLPVDYLKIDGGFVKDMIENASDDALVAAINQMSHALGIETIAEFAHSQEIIARLHELGVDYAQGYFFGQPAPWS